MEAGTARLKLLAMSGRTPSPPRVLGGSALRRSDQCGDFPDHHREAGARQRPEQGRARGRDADPQGTREDQLRDEESLYSAAQEFAQVATEILTETIDELLHYGQVDGR